MFSSDVFQLFENVDVLNTIEVSHESAHGENLSDVSKASFLSSTGDWSYCIVVWGLFELNLVRDFAQFVVAVPVAPKDVQVHLAGYRFRVASFNGALNGLFCVPMGVVLWAHWMLPHLVEGIAAVLNRA